MDVSRLVRNPQITKSEIGGEALLHSVGSEQIHYLNATASVIWDLCDGQHTLEDMEAALRASFAIPAEADVQADVQRTLESLVDKGLLQLGED